jgi:hypothetical protein
MVSEKGLLINNMHKIYKKSLPKDMLVKAGTKPISENQTPIQKQFSKPH